MTLAQIDEAVRLALGLQRRPGIEGLRLRPYPDGGGVPTIGYGTTRYPDGRRVTLSDPSITQAQALEYQRAHLMRECLPVALECCPNLPRPGMLAAILDHIYNCGAPAFKGSTLRMLAAKGDYEGARAQFPRWKYDNGKVAPGLIVRNQERQKLWDLQ